MKALLLPIKPEHALNILNGKKILELRKSVPKGFKGWVYCYVTKGKTRLSVVHDDENGKTYYYLNSNWGRELNATVPFRFWFDEWEVVVRPTFTETYYQKVIKPLLKKSCLTYEELNKYSNDKLLYAWHIKILEVFDKPMKLGDFEKEDYDVMPTNGVWPFNQPISKAPQSYMCVYVKEE